MAENHHSDSKPPASVARERLLAAGFLLLLCTGFYWKLVLTGQYTWFNHPDMSYLEIPRLEFQAREIHHSRFPLWDPHIWAGQPLIGQTQPGPLFPLNLLFFLAPLKSGYITFPALNWYWVAIHAFAAWMFFLLARDSGISKWAAAIMGFVFGCGGFAGTVAWLDVVNGAIWTPLVSLFILRAAEGRRPSHNAALAGLTLGVAWLSGHHELPILISLAGALFWFLGFLRNRGVWKYAALCFIIAALVSAVQIWPTYEFGKLSQRWIGLENTVTWKDKIPYSMHVIYSLPPRGLMATVMPGFGSFADSSPYLGWIPVVFAGVAVAACWRERRVRAMTLLAAFSAAYSMGVFTPLNGWFYALAPVVDKARIPSRAVAILDFSLVALAAFGFEAILRDCALSAAKWARRALALFGIIVVAAGIWTSVAKGGVDDRVLLSALLCLIAAALLKAWSKLAIPRAVLCAGLLALLIIDLTQAGPAFYKHLKDKDGDHFLHPLTRHHDIAQFLRAQPQPVRVSIDDSVMPANFGDWHGIDMLLGYVAGASLNISDHELHTQRMQNVLAITHFLGLKPGKPNQTEVFASADGLKLFRNPDAFPRARAVHQALSVENRAALRAAIQDPANDMRATTVLVGQAPPLESCAAEDRVSIVRRTSDYASIAAQLPCRGMVILADTMYPGWQATVDGKPAKIWEAYGALRGVVVEPGSHVVEMRFRPKSVYYGAALTALGLAIALLFALRRNYSS
ncbi:MAG: YfhO family protein [Candidatus Solibacter usitatus]|nr:YfhO family protein [Candidatus Solibacter usitatus]